MSLKDLKKEDLHPSFFQRSKDKKTGNERWDITKDFCMAMIERDGLVAIPSIYKAGVEDGALFAIVEVKIYREDDKKRELPLAVGVASSASPEKQLGFASDGQKASTFALKNAVEWYYKLTQQKIEELRKIAGITEKSKGVAKIETVEVAEIPEVPVDELEGF